MKINFKENVKDFYGKNILISEEIPATKNKKMVPEKYATFSFVIVDALQAKQEELSIEDKIKRYELCRKILAPAKETHISIEEAALIKKCVGNASAIIVVGEVYNLLDPK